jgi:glycosyltransferase involved in cell wall biosynthesis
MRILFLLTQDLDSPAGFGRYFPMARVLVQRGHQVTMAALHANFASLKVKHFVKEGVRVWYVGQMHVMKQGSQKAYFSTPRMLTVALVATWKLSRAALSTPAEVIQVGKPHPMNGIAGIAGRYLRGARLFVDCDDYEAGLNRFGANWQRGIVAAFERTVPRYAHTVTTHTRFMHDKLMAWGVPSERILYLPNGVEPGRFQPPDLGVLQGLRQEFGLEGKRVVAYIGSLGLHSHPVNLLIEAFAQVHREVEDAFLVIVGGGEDIETLREQVGRMGLTPFVQFHGKVLHEEIHHYYHLAGVIVDPAYDDDAAKGRLPLKLFESWAAQTPFVTADVGDRREILGFPPAGLLARPGDAQSLAACIKQIVTDPDLRAELSQRGLERVHHFSWDQIASRLEGAYLESLG